MCLNPDLCMADGADDQLQLDIGTLCNAIGFTHAHTGCMVPVCQHEDMHREDVACWRSIFVFYKLGFVLAPGVWPQLGNSRAPTEDR